jgi:nicotinamidase/pyrazinamidase
VSERPGGRESEPGPSGRGSGRERVDSPSGRGSGRERVDSPSGPAGGQEREATTARYDASTALLVVDVQNDFADPDGSLYVRDAESVIDVTNTEIEAARSAGAMVVYTQDWHPPVTPHFAKDGGIWPVHCVHGTWGAELHPRLTVVNGERIRVGVGGEDGYSGFTVADPVTGDTERTALDDLLRQRGVERVVVLGLATDYCVRATALDAVTLGYDTTLVVDGVRPVEMEPGDGQRAIDEMSAAGVTLA